MSEADNSQPTPRTPNTPDLSEINSTQIESRSTGQKSTDDRQTKLVQKEIAIAQKLRQENRQLKAKVAELTQQLNESEHQLRVNRKQTKNYNHSIQQQAEAIDRDRTQINGLLQEVEDAHKVVQQQQVLIEDYYTQLEANQKRAAQLERECANLQNAYNQQTPKLLQLEEQVRELNTRLQRQQRYNLQLQSTLDNYTKLNAEQEPQKSQPTSIAQQPIDKIIRGNFTPSKTQPIQPWSARLIELSSSESRENDTSLETTSRETESEGEEDPEAIDKTSHSHKINSTPAHWPSPVIQPLRPLKGRQSQSEIDLPKFN